MRQFADALIRDLHNQREQYKGDLSRGQCKSFDEYQKLCGIIQGLSLAEQHIEDLANHLEKDADG